MANSPDKIIDLAVERAEGFPSLTDQEKSLAIEWRCNGYKVGEAGEFVGLSSSVAGRILRKPLMKAFIAHMGEQIGQDRLITQAFIESAYMELLPKLNGEEEVPLVTPAGEQYSAKKFHSGEMVSVLRDLAKATGYTKEEAIQQGIQVNIDMGALLGRDKPND